MNLFSIAFLNLVFCLVVNNNSYSKLIQLNILKFIKVRSCLFLTAVFSLFSCESDDLTFTQPFIYSHKNFAAPL